MRQGKRAHLESGQRFGRLTVVREAIGIYYGSRPVLNRRWECLCDCGDTTTVRQHYLLHGQTTSCGCLAREVTSARASSQLGEAHPRWVGDGISYGGMHDRLRYNRGLAREHDCLRCNSGAQQWAYRWDLDCPDERLGLAQRGKPLMPYCIHMEHYEPMCHSCHVAFDHNQERRVA